MKSAILIGSVATTLIAGRAMADPTVLGIELGKPLSYPQCPLDPSAPPPDNQPCLQAITGFVLGKELPPYAKTLHPVVENGIVVSIEIITNGMAGEASAYKGLIQKFGPPTKHHITPMQNQFGAKSQNIGAVWQRSAYTVLFSGMVGGDPDSGVIDVATPAYAKDLMDKSENKTTL